MIPIIFRPPGSASFSFDRWGTANSALLTPSNPADGQAISAVANAELDGIAATQGTGADQPVYDTANIASLPMIRFAPGEHLEISLLGDVVAGLIQFDVSALGDGDVIISRDTSASGTDKPAFEIRVVVQ